MTHPPPPARAPQCAAPGSSTDPVQVLTRRLAARGLGVHRSRWRDQDELIILNVTGARSCLTLAASGHARWHYEPRTGSATDPTTLASIILHILSVPTAAPAPPDVGSVSGDIRRERCPHQGFPLKGAVGRHLQGRGLTVMLRTEEDLESFEATTDIEVTSPGRPWLGLVRLSDDGSLEWECDWRAAFHGDPGALINTITPILRAGPGICLPHAPGVAG